MENRTLAKVMWLEEDDFVAEGFIEEAKDYDLDVKRFTSWEAAKKSIEQAPNEWEAIVIDPTCKLDEGGDSNNPKRFLPQVFCDITALSVKNDIIYPWYIFTTLSSEEFREIVIRDREIFDRDWRKPYYDIDHDRTQLLINIQKQTSNRERRNVRNGIHKEMFDKLDELSGFKDGFTKEDVATMEDLMISIYENKDSSRCNFVNLRKIIEGLVKSMIHYKMVPDPDSDPNSLRNPSGEIHLKGYCRILSGLEHNYKTYTLREEILDKVAASNLLTILDFCHGGSHTKSTNVKANKKDVNEYLKITGTKNLLHACTLMLADIILMYGKNYEEHKVEIDSGKSFWSLNTDQGRQNYIGNSSYDYIRK